MKTPHKWITVRTAICHAPVYQTEDLHARCMLCDLATGDHPSEPPRYNYYQDNEYGGGYLSWYRLIEGERDEWSDILEILNR